MKEYIVQVEDDEADHDETFIGIIRQGEELVRCKDCKFFSQTTLGMDFACWHGAAKVWGETGDHESHSVCSRVDSPLHFCKYGIKRGDSLNIDR